jgi:hypothetical protein
VRSSLKVQNTYLHAYHERTSQSSMLRLGGTHGFHTLGHFIFTAIPDNRDHKSGAIAERYIDQLYRAVAPPSAQAENLSLFKESTV